MRARSEKQADACTTSMPSSTTRASPVDRRHCAASKGGQNYDASVKNKQEPPTKFKRRHNKTKSAVYAEHLESSKIVMSLKGWGTQASKTASQCDRKNSVSGWQSEIQQKQKVLGQGHKFRGCCGYRTTINWHQKGVLEMRSLRGYMEPQSATN